MIYLTRPLPATVTTSFVIWAFVSHFVWRDYCFVYLSIFLFFFQLQWPTEGCLHVQRRNPVNFVCFHGRNPLDFPSTILDRLLVVNGRRMNPFLEWVTESEESTDPFTEGVLIWGPPFIGSTVFTLGETILGDRHLDLKKVTTNTSSRAPVAPHAHPIPIPSINWSDERKEKIFIIIQRTDKCYHSNFFYTFFKIVQQKLSTAWYPKF